jgi:phenylalanyl-tRNA synthetase beta chain
MEVVLRYLVGSEKLRFSEDSVSILHPGQGMGIHINEIEAGYFGQLHPGICSQLGFTKNIFVFDLNIGLFAKKETIRYKNISKFPIIKRDIAVVIDEKVTFKEVSDSVKNDASDLLVNLELFDLYQGEGIEKGKKSLALGLTFQSIHGTLKDEEIENNMHNVIKGLSDRLNAKLRE